MATIFENFTTAMTNVSDSVTGTDSLYSKTLTTLDNLYKDMGLGGAERTKVLAEVSAQLAISTSNAAINAAVEMAARADMLPEQVKQEAQKTLLVTEQVEQEEQKTLLATEQVNLEQEKVKLTQRQTTAFDDKLLTEVMKNMGGVAQMEATSGETTEGTLLSTNKAMNFVLKAAGISEDDLYNETATATPAAV